jgi:ABC-type sulfate/molybdate transport systems ATPase subunit
VKEDDSGDGQPDAGLDKKKGKKVYYLINLLREVAATALDNPLRLEMRRFLRDIRNEFNIPTVLVTPDVTEAVTMADTLIVYSKGRMEQTGPPEEIFNNPSSPDMELLVSREVLPT